LAQGIFTRLIGALTIRNTGAIAGLAQDCGCVRTETGKLLAMDLDSGHEPSALDLGFHVRGIIPLDKRILAFDEDWKAIGKYAAFVTWKERELVVEKPVVT
jgi:hypothetical protein